MLSSSKEMPYGAALILFAALFWLTGTVSLWGLADIAPPCGSGLGCAMKSLKIAGVDIRPLALAPLGLVVPMVVLAVPRARQALMPVQWVQAWFAVTLQAATYKVVGSVCPYCVGITLTQLLLAACFTWPDRMPRPFPRRLPLMGVALALATSVNLGFTAIHIEAVKSRPIDLDRLNGVSQMPEATVLGPKSETKREWLVVADPDCPSCDTALHLLAQRLREGDRGSVLLMFEGRQGSGLGLLDLLRSAKTTQEQARALETWPDLRRAGGPVPNDRELKHQLDHQVLRCRSLAVQTAPIELTREHGSPYRLLRNR